MSNRLDQDREKKLQPVRHKRTVEQLQAIGLETLPL
jgi:hypothetical protein